jgi:translocation and assembly module TamB
LVSAQRQQLKLNLKDATFGLQADASHADNKIELPQLLLSAGDARLNAKGELDLKTPRTFTAEGELQHFDPSRFAKVPAAQINASFKTAGRLDPRPVLDGSFTLKDSRVADQPLSGQGSLVIDWPRIPKADIQLVTRDNHLSAKGAFGQPGDTLNIDIDAPNLPPMGLKAASRAIWRSPGRLNNPKSAVN